MKSKKPSYCTDCVYHCQGSSTALRYSNWCSQFSNRADKIIGHCKMNDGKRVAIPIREIADENKS